MRPSRYISIQLFVLALGLVACDRDGEKQGDSQSAEVEQKEASVATPPPPPAPPKVEAPPAWAGRKSAGSGFPCAVEEVLQRSCRRCHWEPQENDAPFPLVKWEDTQKMRTAKPIHVLMQQMVAADLMPPLDALVDPKVDPLAAEDKKVILAWLEGGAAKSDEVCK